MNKFLKLTFKIGKVFSSILLVIVLLVMVGCGIGLLTSDNAPLKTPRFNTLKQTFIEESAKYENNDTDTDASNTTQSDKVAPYTKQIQKIVRKHHLEESVQYVISRNIDRNINEELVKQYLKGLDKFYSDGIRYIDKSEDYRYDILWDTIYEIEGRYAFRPSLVSVAKENYKVNGTYSYYVGAGLAMKYHDLFLDSLRDKAERLQEKAMNKIAQQITFTVSILIFSILLFLPVLIKIEENTRPAEEKEESDTKKCINCGKEIKINAKKCRYCNTWQTESEENNGGNE